jgi:predicted Zn-dependent protease
MPAGARAAWLALLAAVLAGCGGEPGDPFAALAAGDHAGARRAFERELAAEPPESERWLDLTIGHLAALAHEDARKAAEDALALLAAEPARLGERGAVRLADALLHAERFDAARKLLEGTVAAWPESRLLDAKYSDVLARMATSGSAEDLRALDGLGYTKSEVGQWRSRPGAVPTRRTAARAEPAAD